MFDLFSGSLIAGGCRRVTAAVRATAEKSLLFGPRSAGTAMENSGLARALNRFHPVEATVGALSRSGLLGWLYDYWGNLCAQPVQRLCWLPAPLLFLLSLRMVASGRFLPAGALLVFAGLSLLLLLARGTLGDWLGGMWLSRFWVLPRGEAKPSVTVWLVISGVLGGAVGWYAGVTYALLAAGALALLPVVFRGTPYAMLCLLLCLLPVTGTALCWVMSAAVVAFYFLARAFGGHPGKKIGGLDLVLTVFPILCIVSAAFSFHRPDSFKVIAMWLGLYLCVPLVGRIITDRKKLVGALVSLTVGATLAGIYGVFQYVSGMTNDTWTDTALFDNIQLRVYSTFANPNVYGEFLLMVIPLVAGLALYLRGTKRWLLLAVDALLTVNMVLSYSRGCYVGIALTAVVFFWNFSKKWLAALAAVGLPLAILMMPASVMDRILSIGNMSDTSTSYRVMIYIGTFMMFAVYWFSGVGIGERAFNTIYPHFALYQITAQHSHSLFFQSVVSFGIVGLIYLIMLFVLYQRRMKAAETALRKGDRLLMLGFGSVMWGMLVQSVFDYTWYNYRVFQLFWLVLVLGFAAANVLQERKDENG